MADESPPDRVMTLADIKDAIETLVLAQMKANVAIKDILAVLHDNKLDEYSDRILKANEASFKSSADLYEKFIRLKVR